MKTKIYDLVKQLLTDNPELRNSDKKLIWEIWKRCGLTYFYPNNDDGGYISFDNFMKAPSFESCRRTRQKIQEHHPELQASEEVKKLRKKKQESKSTFVYREEVTSNMIFNPITKCYEYK